MNQTTGAVITNDMSFSAWGGRREPGTWLPPVGTTETQADHAADRYGFTHQEMLDNVGIIHMNGRIYDPSLGRFLSVDPVFEFPTNTQSLNPYSYVLNNPLSMTDPTGYVESCGTGKTSCPDNFAPGKTGSITVKTTATELGSHIATHGTTTLTGTMDKAGNMQVTASGNGFGLGETADVSVDRGAGNGAQNSSQGPGTSLGLSTSSNQGGNTAPAFNAVVTSSNSATTENQPAASNEAQEGALAEKTFNDLPDAIKHHYRSDPKERGTLLSRYAKVKLILIRGFKPGETAETCKTGCEPGEWKPSTPNDIYIYTGQALAGGVTKEGGAFGMMWLIAHEFDHSTAENQALYPEYMSTHPWLDAHDIGQMEKDPVQGRALPWELNADLFGHNMAAAYDALHPD